MALVKDSLMSTKYLPRNEYVVLKQTKLDTTDGGVALPDSCVQGYEFTVHSVGAEVTDLEPGDKVLFIGARGEDYAYLPGKPDLLITKQANILLRFGD